MRVPLNQGSCRGLYCAPILVHHHLDHAAPGRVQLWFNERLEAQFSTISVWDASGQQMDNKDMQVGPDDHKKLSVGLPDLTPGMYTVKFRVLSVDGHIVESEYPFMVRGRQ
jgi:methionine-rich copper-binding protein CopC